MKSNVTMTKEIKEIKQRIAYRTPETSVREDTILYADGDEETHEIIESPQGVLVLAVTSGGKIILNKEYRHNHGLVYGVPMGKLEEKDANPLDGAKRELREETGLSANNWILVSTHHNGIHEEGLNYFYIAQDLTNGEISQDVDEHIETTEVTFKEAFMLIDKGEIVDLPSRACIWAGYIYMHENGMIS